MKRTSQPRFYRTTQWRRNTWTFSQTTFSIWILRRLSPQLNGNVNNSNTLLWEWMNSLKRYFGKDSSRRRKLLLLIGRSSENV